MDHLVLRRQAFGAGIMNSTKILSDDLVSWSNASILSVTQFDEEALTLIVKISEDMRRSYDLGEQLGILRGRILGCLFYEPSTRTSSSFQAAMLRLGGTVLNLSESTSSSMKGESFEDTVRSMACYCDALVVRHPMPGAALQAARASPSSIINAGDGIGEHPTQALLDLYTLFREFSESGCETIDLRGTLRHKKIALVGDLKHGRTVHSLAQLLSLFDVNNGAPMLLN